MSAHRHAKVSTASCPPGLEAPRGLSLSHCNRPEMDGSGTTPSVLPCLLSFLVDFQVGQQGHVHREVLAARMGSPRTQLMVCSEGTSMPVLPAPTASLPDESSCGTTQPGSPNSCQGNGMGSVGPPQGAPSLARVDPAQPFISTLQVRLSSGPSSSGLHSGGFPEGKQECETVDPRALPLPSPTLTHIPCSSLKSSKSRKLPG